MVVISIAIFLMLSIISLIHLAWALGSVWPAKSPQELAEMVIGQPGVSKVPPFGLTVLVGMAIFLAGICALWGAGTISLPLPGWMRSVSNYLLLLIFFARGLSTYLLDGPLEKPSIEPFRTLDRRYYAPLCLLIAAGFMVIIAGNY